MRSPKQLLVDSNNHWEGLVPLETPCLLPNGTEHFETLFCHDHYSKIITQNYFRFLYQSNWRLPEVMDCLNEMLIALREADTEKRRYYAENPGCFCYDPNLKQSENW